jgi:nitrogen fixation protein NifU and related proteins
MQKKIGINLYHETLMDHYQHPRNVGHLEQPDFSSEEVNPSCGDRIHFEGKINKEVITKIAFTGYGCVISQAAASMLSEHVINKTINQVIAMNKEDMLKLLGVELGPMRVRCAMLPLQALQQGLLAYKKEK